MFWRVVEKKRVNGIDKEVRAPRKTALLRKGKITLRNLDLEPIFDLRRRPFTQEKMYAPTCSRSRPPEYRAVSLLVGDAHPTPLHGSLPHFAPEPPGWQEKRGEEEKRRRGEGRGKRLSRCHPNPLAAGEGEYA
jgi:hypothetical protein